MRLAEIQAAITRGRAGRLAVFRSSPAGSAGVPGAAIHARVHGVAALVLFHPGAGRAAEVVHKIESQRWMSCRGKIEFVCRVGRNGGAAARADWAARRRSRCSIRAKCAIPYVAMVDAGTIELVRGLGVEIATSANLIQYFEARWTAEQLESHLEAGRRIDRDAARMRSNASAQNSERASG